MKTIKASHFIDRDGRRVLTDTGKPGRDGKEGCGSTTEQMQGEVAAAIFAHGPRLNNAQLDELIGWLKLFKTNDEPIGGSAALLNTHEQALLTLFRASSDEVKQAILSGLLGATPALVGLPLEMFESALKTQLATIWPGQSLVPATSS